MTELKTLLEETGTELKPLNQQEQWKLKQKWRENYSQGVKERTGKWIHNGFDWHAFSYGFATASSGEKAFAEYRAVCAKDFFVVPEDFSGQIGYRCYGISLPDLSSLGDDLYVFPPSMEWTMAFTHEGPDIGPYFARKEWQKLASIRSR